ncbi:alpha/beta hydrolase [Achromobacter xylosoxidans]|uniref:alpha/beta fold hydrolase n=1 Tax=Alcaligenes xylosoxydans xylosoxydans TaxID=85698 RepID=UPI0006C6B1D5|nr:alpha/beta fold hydrolase [Achromobacter xylosoxidans]MCH4572730.1 alpha/beta fold hydrolase [Achromobacter xylosoxidans]MDD7990040.1 alpha/beta fold hydrolase [Achromobacter xylosoxidans]NEV05357.1 alpha/beta fold hydrolase [Achromobacter xylosoxidans]OFO62534.1 esterase [Achromobacter xylosoxidans]OMG86168.1 esterase [Achromobacter xylosoxidans]
MPDAPVLLKSLRSHFLGGREAVASGLPVLRRQVVGNGAARAIDMNGSYCAGQLYVQEYRLAEPRHPHPVLLWHGGGMSGAQWESTPDGRQGWLWRLLQSGYDVFVADAPERGRASWAMYPQIYDAAPIFRSKEEAWHLFRIGPANGYAPRGQPRRAHPGQQFPADAFDTFAKQFVPRWLAHDAMALDAYRELLDLAGPCIVIGHSQGGGYATQLARECPGPIRAVVAVEPTGTPERVDGSLPPQLLIWGDHFDHHDTWQRYRAQTDAYWDALRRAGRRADVLDLPAAGIAGNSHFCMLDRNSDRIAELIVDWLNGLD